MFRPALSVPFKMILGSSSMSRRQILAEMGYEFTIMSADIDEKAIRMEDPKELVMTLAEAKADAILSKLKASRDNEESEIERPTLLITADQVVVHEGVIREKPSSKEEARQFIRSYSKGCASTIGSVLVTNIKTGIKRGGCDTAEVYFHEIPDDVIESLIEEGTVLYVAGGLLVESPLTSPFVSAMVGTMDSVMGLPKALTEKLIHEALQTSVSKSINLYADFYSSDIIVASPVQLVQAIGKAETEKGKDVDYMSSIEVLIIDHADIIAMQNWFHVNSVLEKMNAIPSEQHGSDVMRVSGWSCTLLSTEHYFRLLSQPGATFSNLCVNYKGKVNSVSEYKGVLPKVLLPVRQFFERFDSSIINADDDRFNYFTKKIFPKTKDSAQGGVMIFLSCYFQFVRIRNFLKSQNASFCVLGEYTKQSDISRARGWFFKGERKIMLYTERAHFYHRYKIRGIQNLIFYSLPERKEFYPEIVNMLDGAQSMSSSVIFSRLDTLQLERIVGSTACKKMLSSEKDIFVFY